MNAKLVWGAALAIPLVVSGQCRVTDLGTPVNEYSFTPVALDNNGNAMTVSPEGVATIWGSDGTVKAVAPVKKSSLRPFLYSMNDKGEALIASDSCVGPFPSYSTNLAIWNWRNGSVKCLQKLPFELEDDFMNSGYLATVLDNSGWVYTTVSGKTLNGYKAVAWPPNRSAVLFPSGGEGAQFVYGGSATGWVVGSKSAPYPGSQPVAMKDQSVVDTISWPTEWGGHLYAAATNGDMLGYAANDPSGGGSLVLLTNEGRSFEYLNYYSVSHLNSKRQLLGSNGFGETFIVSNGKSIPLHKRMPADWSQSGRSISYLGGLNDKSQILAKYNVDSVSERLTGTVLLSGCFGGKP
jgi:hypothetical protein